MTTFLTLRPQLPDSAKAVLVVLPSCSGFRAGTYLKIVLTLVALFCFLAFSPKAQGQTQYKMAAGSQIKVSGTSNLHDWSMLASDFNSEGSFLVTEGQLQDIQALHFMLPVANLKSKDDLMDSRAYKALRAEKHDKINFKLTAATVVPQQKLIKATGSLTIGGVTNQVALQTAYVLNADESITCKGSKSIKMSDYKIQAPSFMMGSLKTGDEVTIDILLKLKKQAPNNPASGSK